MPTSPNEVLCCPSGKQGLLAAACNSSVRVTWQATPTNKIAGTYKTDPWCECPNGISALIAPEAARDFRFPRAPAGAP